MSKLTREEMDRFINEHFAYEAQDDVDGVVSTLTEDVEHDIVGSPGSQVTRARVSPHGLAEGLPFKGSKS
jgi:hypothetical protein